MTDDDDEERRERAGEGGRERTGSEAVAHLPPSPLLLSVQREGAFYEAPPITATTVRAR